MLLEYVEKLGRDSLLSSELLDEAVSIEDSIERLHKKAELEEQARKKSCLTSFRELYSAHEKKATELKHKKKSEKEGYSLDLAKYHHFDGSGNVSGVFDHEIYHDLKEKHDAMFIGGVPYMYQGGYYKANHSGSVLKTEIQKLIYPEMLKSTTVIRIYNLFTFDDELQVDYEECNDYPVEWIPFKNGMYDPINRKIIPHEPKYKAINQIPHDYIPEGKPKGNNIEEWLNFIVPDADDREMLLQYMGLCLTRDTRQQKFLILVGEGGSGKSTLINLLERMVGAENCSHISLKELTQRFAAIGLMGKMVNSCADLETSAIEDASILKKLLGEDSLRGEAKGRDAISFNSYARLIFSTNELPTVLNERSNGFFRRLLSLNMSKQPKSKRTNFLESLTEEVDYLIHLCVDALERLYHSESGIIMESKGSVEAVTAFRKDCDSVEAFLQDECVLYNGAKTSKNELHLKYDKYCENQDRQSLSRNSFFKALRTKGFKESQAHSGERFFLGISTNKDDSWKTGDIPEDFPFS